MRYIFRTLDGVLDGDAATVADFAALKTRLAGGQRKMLLHLHGGLIDEAAGIKIAETLSGVKPTGFGLDDGWDQVFVVWRTGGFETLRHNWTDLFDRDRLYQVLLQRLIEFVSGQIRVPGPGGRGAGPSVKLSRAEIRAALAARPAGDPFAGINDTVLPPSPAGRATALVEQSDAALMLEFQSLLSEDAAFNDAIQPIDASINRAAEGRGGAVVPPALAADGEAHLARLNLAVQAPIRALAPTDAPGRMSAVGIAGFILKHAGRIVLRIIRRIRAGRDHGFYATIVEELLRELYGDFIGATMWGAMKGYAEHHFSPGHFGGALLAAIPDDTRLVVTAHSAGSIWAAHLLKALAAGQRGLKLDLVLLAPAVRMDQFAEALTVGGGAVSESRLFAMHDAIERVDAVLGHDKGYLYPSSLLYLVSGLFEEIDDKAMVDAPLVGLERFLAGAAPWLTEPDQVAAIDTVGQFFQQPGHGIVYSLTDAGAGVGYRSQSTAHGDFDNDGPTLESVGTFFL